MKNNNKSKKEKVGKKIDKPAKKTITKKVSKINKKKKGFTLIELLAVIIILGILMIIAIPSVTKYINDSRRSAYVDTANEIIGAARNLVNSGKEEMYDTDATYYLDVKCIGTENAMKSPYGEFVDLGAFVVVTYNGKGYDYYWTSVDDSGQGIKDIIKSDKLDVNNIESDLSIDDIKTNRTIDGRSKVILITERNNCQKEGTITENLTHVSSSGGVVIYPTGKTKETVVLGDIVTIDTEEFYVVKHDGSDLVLLSRYNLNVGSNMKPGTQEGIQDSEVRGLVANGPRYGNIAFSSTNYWDGKVGTDYPGIYCTSSSETNCVYIYDSNSNLKIYVDAYKAYLEGKGATIKSARLLKVEEAFELGCSTSGWNCSSAPAFLKETSFWLGSAILYNNPWKVDAFDGFAGNYCGDGFSNGVRPVIVI